MPPNRNMPSPSIVPVLACTVLACTVLACTVLACTVLAGVGGAGGKRAPW